MKNLLFILILFGLTAPLAAQSYVQLTNRWQKDGKSTYHVHLQDPQPAAGPTEPGWWSKDWIVEDAGDGYIRFKNRWRGTYLLQNVDSGPTEAGEAKPGWWSAQWKLEPAGGNYYRLKNRWRGTYLHIQNAQPECGTVEPGWWSAQWELTGYKGAQPQPQPQPQPRVDPQPGPAVNYAMGARVTPPENLQLVKKVTSGIKTAPAQRSFTLDMPPVGNQGGEGSCVAWAVGYGVMSYEMKRSSGQGYFLPHSTVVSPTGVASAEYLFNRTNVNNNNCARGSFFVGSPTTRGALDFLRYEGITNALETPYSDANGCGDEENHQMPVSPNASRNRIREYAKIQDLTANNLKNLITSGYPIIVGANLSPGFLRAGPDFVWRSGVGGTQGSPHARHAMVLIGFDDAKRAFKIQNSWGTGWGDKGYGWISYDHVPRAVYEAYVIYAGQLQGYEVYEPNYVTVYSEAGYVANVKLQYTLNGRRQKVEEKLSLFFTFEHEIPQGAVDVELEVTGIAVIDGLDFKKKFPAGNIQQCYKIWGTIFDTEYGSINCSY